METVVEAKEKIAKPWGTGSVTKTEYRLLKYIIEREIDGKLRLCNR